MPKEWTHWIIAEQAAAALPAASAIRKLLEGERESFLAGAVLPDTLMHLFRGPHAATALRLAHHFHDQQGNSFEPIIRAEERCGRLSPPLFSCVLGMLAHMQADMALHPYVFGVTGKEIGEHYRLETVIDVRLVRGGVRPPSRRLRPLVTPKNEKVLLQAMRLVFDPGRELTDAALEQSLRLHVTFQDLYHRTWCRLATALIGPLCRSPLREQRHLFYPLWGKGAPEVETWVHPVTGVSCGKNVEELVREAVRLTAEMFLVIEEAGSLAQALHERPGANLLTGMGGVGLP